MKFAIKHEIKGRLRVHMAQQRMTYEQADVLQYYLQQSDLVVDAKVYEQTADVVISYNGDRAAIIHLLCTFKYQLVEVPEGYLESTGRELNSEYKEKLICKVVWHYGKKLFLPAPIRNVITIVNGIRYIWKGLQSLRHRRLDVDVLDATGIAVSLLRQDMGTAGSVMFLLGIGELLEEWTHKKSVGDLARSMSLNVEKVWQKVGDQEVLVSSSTIEKGDAIIIHAGNVIPFDGVVTAGDATVNQASLTGESVPVAKTIDSYVYAGTVLEEGELIIRVEATGGATKYEKIVTMIEDSEKLKSNLEGKAEHLADKLVPYTLGGTLLTWLLTRNATKALSILMVDFSCALKLAMPISVLSAIREAQQCDITVKGGKYLEAVAEATTIVFDKTGTLTKGVFKVTKVSPVGISEKELIEYAAYAEVNSNHPIAKSIVNYYKESIDLEKITYFEEIAAHGIKVKYNDLHILAGNDKLMSSENILYFKTDDIGTVVYIAVNGAYRGYIVISDEIKEDSKEAIKKLKLSGVKEVVMLTGDNENVANKIAKELGIDKVYSNLLPNEKVDRLEEIFKNKLSKEKVAFVGDGINDAPVLARADVGIAMGALGSDAAIEAADVVLMTDEPSKIAKAIEIARKTNKIVWQNIVFALGVKAIVLILSAGGVATMWEAIFADVGVALIAVLNAMRVMK